MFFSLRRSDTRLLRSWTITNRLWRFECQGVNLSIGIWDYWLEENQLNSKSLFEVFVCHGYSFNAARVKQLEILTQDRDYKGAVLIPDELSTIFHTLCY